MDIEKISLIAQEISFAFEDAYYHEEKKKLFISLFEKYLSPVDPSGAMEPYDIIILLGRKNPSAFERMVKEMKGHQLVT